MIKEPEIKLHPLCESHKAEIVQKAKYLETDPWQLLLIAASVALFQGATSTDSVHKKIGGDIHKLYDLGCLACRLPYKWEELLQVTRNQPKDLGAIKTLGENWVSEAIERRTAKDETK